MNISARRSFLYLMNELVRQRQVFGLNETSFIEAEAASTRRFIAFAIAALFSFGASCNNAHAFGTVELASGGPYVGTGRGLQRFNATLPASSGNRPSYITIYNGGVGKLGFTFVRVILTNQMLQSYGATEPQGMVLADRNSFQIRNTVTKDVTGELGQGASLFIEAEGARGAQLSWVLSGPSAPTLSPLNPSETLSGRNITLHGSNFSPVPSDNTVTFGGKQATVVSATRTTLTVKPPDSVESGSAAITVSVAGMASNPINMAVRPMPILTGLYPAGGPPGETLIVYGRGFARPLQANVVRVGPFTAQVVGATDNGGLRCIIPNWGTDYQGLPVSVYADGVPSRNSLIFYPNNHIFIEGSAF